MNIGIDIDDTISDTYTLLFNASQKYEIEELGRSGEIREVGNCTHHSYLKVMYDWTQEQEDEFVYKYYKDSIENVKIKPYAKEVIQKLKQEGHTIYIVTARASDEKVPNVKLLTEQWLQRNGICYDELIVNARNKLEIVKDKKIDIFIDDSYFNCKPIADHKIKTFLMDTRANANIPCENMTRVYSWPYLYKQLKQL